MRVPPSDPHGTALGGSRHFSYVARHAAPGKARAAITAYAREHGAGPDLLSAIALAVSEAVTNAVVHAYRDGAVPGRVELTASAARGELTVTVSDNGSGLRATRNNPGLGLGLALIAQSADGFDLERGSAGGLVVRMRFRLDR
ncbi:MAG: ATP-binding protein [Solirubrobacteraceae bacterium]